MVKIKTYLSIVLVCLTSTINAQLTINPGGYITINPTGSMYVGTSLNLNSDASGSGYWVDRTTGNNVTVSGNINVERYIAQSGWHNTAAPVNNAVSSVYTGTDLVFYYDETIILNDWNFGWVWFSGALSAMKGYDVYTSAPLLVSYTSPSGNSLNSGTYTIGVTRTDVSNGETEDHKGWNLIGNPYPSPVDWLEEQGWDKTDINDAKYIWNPANNNYTIFLGGSNPAGVNGGTRFIPSNQGFWVQALHNGTVEINNACRTGTTSGTPDYYKKSNASTQELRITAYGNGYSDETLIRFLPWATGAFDTNLDACKLFSYSDSVPQISTIENNNRLAINSLQEITPNLSVKLEFCCNAQGLYTLSANNTGKLFNFNQIYLFDICKQKLIHLNTEPQYRFFHTPDFDTKRFIILFNPDEKFIDNLASENLFTVSVNGNVITIKSNIELNSNASVAVYNITGQRIYFSRMADRTKAIFELKATPGYYIVSIKTSTHISNVKVFLSG